MNFSMHMTVCSKFPFSGVQSARYTNIFLFYFTPLARDCHLPYLNFTAFTARCLQAGIHEVFPPFPDNAYNHFWYAQNVLNRNLNVPNYEENNRRLTVRRRMGAALYIIFAGTTCFEHLVLNVAVRGKGKRLWPLWMKAFEDVVKGTGEAGMIMKNATCETERDKKVLQELRSLCADALEKMRLLWKALEKEEEASSYEASYGNGYRQYHDSHDRHDTVH